MQANTMGKSDHQVDSLSCEENFNFIRAFFLNLQPPHLALLPLACMHISAMLTKYIE